MRAYVSWDPCDSWEQLFRDRDLKVILGLYRLTQEAVKNQEEEGRQDVGLSHPALLQPQQQSQLLDRDARSGNHTPPQQQQI